MIHKAYLFAAKAHDEQTRDGGQPQLDHVCKVADIVRQLIHDNPEFSIDDYETIVCAAYLHDTIEDTDIEYKDIVEAFNKRIGDLVMELTHEGKKDSYGYYFPRLKSKEGIIIKLADRMANIANMGAWDIGRQEHYLKKTQFWKDGSDL